MDGTIAQQQQSFDRIRYPQSEFIMNPLDLSSLSYYDSSADFSAESAPSRGSPISPVFGNSYQLPLDSEWPAYLDKPSMSPDMDVFFGESFGSRPAFPASQNPDITSSNPNPLDIMDETVSFGRDDLNDAPLFQDIGEPVLNATASAPMQGHQQQQQHQQQQARTAQPAASTPKMQTRSQQRGAQRVPARSSDLKRKTSSCDSASSRSASPEPPARRAKHNAASDPSKNPHNLIEKRYRVNINEKIVALRDAVPSLRCALNLQQQHPEGTPNDAAAAAAGDEALDVTPEELGGLMPARKLNKATILSKATEYIGHLEKKNDQLAKENRELQKRLAEAQRWQRTQSEENGYWA